MWEAWLRRAAALNRSPAEIREEMEDYINRPVPEIRETDAEHLAKRWPWSAEAIYRAFASVPT